MKKILLILALLASPILAQQDPWKPYDPPATNENAGKKPKPPNPIPESKTVGIFLISSAIGILAYKRYLAKKHGNNQSSPL